MKKDNLNQLKNLLSHSGGWMSASDLAFLLHVSTKTIRNYVKELNENQNMSIETSSKGYRLQTSAEPKKASGSSQESQIDQDRKDRILSLLLGTRSGLSIFDLAETLYVSDGTIVSDIQQLKPLLATFNLRIVSHDYTVALRGEEKEIRRLIGWMMVHESPNWFTSIHTLQQLCPDVDVQEVQTFLMKSAKECGLLLNSYALQNLISHLLIILVRIGLEHDLTSQPCDPSRVDHLLAMSCQKENVEQFVQKIRQYCLQVTGKEMSYNDLEQITALTVVSGKLFELNPESLDTFAAFIDRDFFNTIIQIVLRMDNRYGLPHMNNLALCQFVLHVYNLYWRANVGLSYPNPLAAQIKKDYAPIYDVAVWFSHAFSKTFQVQISEDEIGYIAFHLGACLGQDDRKRIDCLIIAEDYYGTAKQLVHELHYSFGEELHVLRTAPFSEITKAEIEEAELILSTTPFAFGKRSVVFINPILTQKDLMAIRHQIDRIHHQRIRMEIITFLLTIFQESLYFRNVDAGDNPEQIIRFLCSQAMELGCCDESFVEDVLAREALSSTAFTDQCAIPHGVAQPTSSSFVVVLHNDAPLNWNGRFVNFVLLIGVREQDMPRFRNVFNLIVESFSNVERTLALLKTNDWADFIQVLTAE